MYRTLKNKWSEKLFFYQFFVGVLKVNDENSRIRSRIRTNMSRIHNTAEELLLTFKKYIKIVQQRQCLPLPAVRYFL
jgi:hypothetical protein